MAQHTFRWNFGLLNHAAKKYLTGETFGFKLNIDGVSLKKKQMWTLEQDEDREVCYFKSHLNRYLSSDPRGNVKCEEEERGPDTEFTIETQPDGKWALKNSHGAYFGGAGDQLKCVAKPSPSELWSIQLAMHPQINLKSAIRKRFAHFDVKTESIQATEVIPWGEDATITLEFDESQGKYAFRASNKKYLKSNGSLSETISGDCLFTIEFHRGKVAFRNEKGFYLAALGSGKIQAGKNTTVGKDELFIMQDSPPQVSFIGQRGRRLSIHQGMDVTLNRRGDCEDTEIFQLEFDKSSDKAMVAIVGTTGKYWALEAKGVTASASEPAANTQFELEWHGKQIAFKAHTGKYIAGKDNGQLIEGSDELDETTGLHIIELVNRPVLVLRGEHGFVGVKVGSNRLESNRSKFDVFMVTCDNGNYEICTDSGKYWSTDESDNIVLSDSKTSGCKFTIELPKYNQLAIKASNGHYIKGHQNGAFSATGESLVSSTLWEY